MQVISLNVQHGGGPRAQRLLQWLTARSPDVIALPEWRNNDPGAVLKSGLEAKGFQTATATTNSDNGILFAAKRPFKSRCCTPHDARVGRPFSRNEGRGAELLIADFGDLRMLAAYFPGGKLKVAFFEVCAAQAEASAVPFLLLGDLNTGRNDIDKEPNGTPFDCVAEFKALPLVDLWRAQHGDTAREWTWYSPKSAKRRSNGFRLDHAFANAAFRKRFPIIRCVYDHTPRETNLTDHSALVLSGSETEIR
jgi:exodeoxyribonuclease III